MDRRAPPPPAQRDIMFCHQCENEWYRDEHGLACPECQSEFCEVIEAHNDPREDNADPAMPWNAPDPDEDDIDQFTHRRNSASERDRGTQTGGGFAGLIGSAIQGVLGNLLQPPDYNSPQNRPRSEGEPGDQYHDDNRASPTSTTTTRHYQQGGFSVTMTTSSSSNLRPRDVHGAQPFQRQPQTIDELMVQMLNNIGAVGPGMHNQRGAHEYPGSGHSPFMYGGPPALFQLLGLPMGGALGDAVFSQEGLDRVITQLMEQNQTGNAPGPASSSAIDNLPTREITKKDLGDDGTAECSICMDPVELGGKVTVLPCQHWFHADCVGAWLREHDTCPHCRKGIMPDHDANAASPRSPAQAPLNDAHSSTGTRMPGAYPFPRTNSGGRTSQTGSASGAGVFDRMREAFGGGSTSQNRRE